MGININKIFEHIDKIGIQKTIEKINSYNVDGPTAEQFFGKESVSNLEKEINKNKE